MRLALAEQFVSFQGEGPQTGVLSAFIRLAGCEGGCSWCDTPQAQDMESAPQVDVERIVERIPSQVRNVVITGGEPLLQWRGVEQLVRALCGPISRTVAVETSGAIAAATPNNSGFRFLLSWFDCVVLSPKLASASGVFALDRHLDGGYPYVSAMGFFPSERTCLKFVVTEHEEQADLREVDEVVKALDVRPERVWLMPEGDTPDMIHSGLSSLWHHAITRGYNLSPRMHVQVFGNKRGV